MNALTKVRESFQMDCEHVGIGAIIQIITLSFGIDGVTTTKIRDELGVVCAKPAFSVTARSCWLVAILRLIR